MTRLAHGSPNPKPITVLVVDDDLQYVRSLCRLLGVAGFSARGESDAEAAVTQAAEWRPDVILVDYFMPGLTGDQVIARIRSFDPLVPCVVISGYAGSRRPDLLRNPDVQAVHEKAGNPSDIVRWVQIWGEAHRALRTLDPEAGSARAGIELLTALCRVRAVDRFECALTRLAQAVGGQQAPAALATTASGPVLGTAGAYAGARSLAVTGVADLVGAPRAEPVYWTHGHVVVRWATGVAVACAPEPDAATLRALSPFPAVLQALHAASSVADPSSVGPWVP